MIYDNIGNIIFIINESAKTMYYRITYDGDGIYNALKNNISIKVWKKLLSDKCMTWLPKPPLYNGNYRSYFTKHGYEKFMEYTYPVIIKYLNKNSIIFEEIEINQNPVYRDKYQIVISNDQYNEDNMQSQILYHGSNSKLSVIKSQISTHGKSWVYAASDYYFALCYAGKQWDDLKINQCYYNGELILTEIEKGSFIKYFDCSGYIYSFSGYNFKKLNKHEFVSTKPVYIKDCTIEFIPNVLSAIMDSKIKLYYYPNLPPFINDRNDYINKKKEQFSIN